MKITQLTIKNFRSFGPTAVVVNLDDLTTLIGTNGTGKTAVLQALVRLFGSSGERRFAASDFHRKAGEELDSAETRSLMIEARIEFPGAGQNDDAGIPECFNQMSVTGADGRLFCRIRAEAVWTRGASAEGEIDEHAFWITSEDDEPGVDARRPLSNNDRSLIQVVYVPAARDPSKQLRQVSGTILHRLVRTVQWTEETKKAFIEASAGIGEAFSKEDGVQSIQGAISAAWGKLHASAWHKNVVLQPVEARFEDMIKHLEAVFQPDDGSGQQGIDELSDGLKSLFYLSLIGAVFGIEQDARIKKAVSGLAVDDLRLPSLTFIAVEEPENHLSPHYLGRILAAFEGVSKSPNGQAIITSQSPSVVGRVEPDSIRHFRIEAGQGTSVKPITLPDEEDEGDEHKFVKEAVRAFPELYFSTLVVLGEGDTEELVLPKLASAHGMPVKTGFVSFVPLGGRHVNHFWRLLSDLSIPYVTLLDLDRERHGGGWARIKQVCKELLKIGIPRADLLTVKSGKILSDADLEGMHDWNLTASGLSSLQTWIDRLEEFDVFLSGPLDLDFLMFEAFPAAYQGTAVVGPRLPKDPAKLDARIQAAVTAVLKDSGGDGATYTQDEKKSFAWYSYLFLDRGKPATHIRALSAISEEDLKKHTPPILLRLIERMKELSAKHSAL